MKILVTGSEGFIGKALVKKLNEDVRNKVYEYDTKNSYNFGAQWFDRSYDLIYHLGAISDTQETDKSLIFRRNIIFLQDLISHARRSKTHIIFASSASVYGPTSAPSTVDDKVSPQTDYAKSKLAGEYILELSEVPCTIYRLFNVYSTDGYSEVHKKGHASPHHTFLNQNPIKVFEMSERIYRDFIHIDEVLNTLIQKPIRTGTFNVGTGMPKSFLEVAKEISKKTGAEIETIPFPQHLKQNYQYYTCAG